MLIEINFLLTGVYSRVDKVIETKNSFLIYKVNSFLQEYQIIELITTVIFLIRLQHSCRIYVGY
jgi:hypothetical protein